MSAFGPDHGKFSPQTPPETPEWVKKMKSKLSGSKDSDEQTTTAPNQAKQTSSTNGTTADKKADPMGMYGVQCKW